MNRAPEPTEADIARAAVATAQEVFDGSDGHLTVAYYRRLCAKGPLGVVAMNLFRAQKTSNRAKKYHGRQYRSASYDVKNYSLGELCGAIATLTEFKWGWKKDPDTPGFEWVLYVELPTGQISFHSGVRGSGQEYAGQWDGQHESQNRILQWCDQLLK